ncbi:MAG: sigma-70 family RNA polymerase sigma factor, partial [Oscillospiraceae bacterium]|nr:sigma-70 family RNA polymerase sigma factor [Oscillospiraceae bacterium]
NRLADAVRRSSSGRNRILNESVPFPEDDDVNDLFYDESPEETAILREEYLRIREKMDRVLSAREREALILYSSGYSYSEIAEKTGMTPKAVGNAIQRARKKLRQE